MRSHLTRTLLAGAVVLAAVLIPSTPAAAHVTVTPTTVTAGGRATFTVKVPNERDGAATVKVELAFPDNAALTSVSLRPVPGWTATVQRGPSGETATAITWQSTTGVQPGEFQTFDVAVGPLPKQPTTLLFKAVQTYSNGEVVRWIEPPRDGAVPDHPAMVVTVAAPSPSAPVAAAGAGDGGSADGGSADGGSALPVAALAVALLALVAALGALARRRPGAAPEATPRAARPAAAGKR